MTLTLVEIIHALFFQGNISAARGSQPSLWAPPSAFSPGDWRQELTGPGEAVGTGDMGGGNRQQTVTSSGNIKTAQLELRRNRHELPRGLYLNIGELALILI